MEAQARSLALVKPPTRNELEALSLADRIALEDLLDKALPVLRELNDAEIWRLHEAGASQRAIAEAMGVSRDVARRRLARMGLAAEHPSTVGQVPQPPPQNGDAAGRSDISIPSQAEMEDTLARRARAKGEPLPLWDHLPDMLPGAEPEGAFRQEVVAWCSRERRLTNAMEDTGIRLVAKSDNDREALLEALGRIHALATKLEGELSNG
jgi:hypothetical protein